MIRKTPIADAAREDHAAADRYRTARATLHEHGAKALDPRPWRPASHPSAIDLAHFALWRSPDLPTDGLLSALTLLAEARSEVEGLEAGLLFVARNAGLTWAEIAESMGFNSPQACQQHYNRLTERRSSRR
ncbi:DNA-binding protein [Microbacterium lushaniae]|nr:DNA-binding protein [Microbacterium lushaniae]